MRLVPRRSGVTLAIATAALVLTSICTGGIATADTMPSRPAISTPAQFQSLPSAPVTVTGTAADDISVASVWVTIRNMDTNRSSSSSATLASPGARSTGWRLTTNLAAGDYSATAQARDGAGHISALSSARRFDVAKPAGQAYLTLMFGRSQWALASDTCQPETNTVPLNQVAAELHRRGIVGTGAVIGDRTAESSTTCYSGALYPSWQQLAQLRDDYGMRFVSAGVSHVDNTLLTAAQQYANVCGSLPAMLAHGHDRAWGTFAYPNGKQSLALQTTTTSRCFAYGRVYQMGRSHQDIVSRSPWLERTNSLAGGACNAPALPCYSLRVRSGRYFSRDVLARLMAVGPGEWSTVYMYKFISGSHDAASTSAVRWDCTAPDWRAHWTTVPETYCWNDYLAALDAIPSNVTVVDPATVAQAWNSDSLAPMTTIRSGPADGASGASVAFSFTASDARSWFTCSLDGGAADLCDSGVVYTSLAPGPHTFTVKASDAFGNIETVPAAYSWISS